MYDFKTIKCSHISEIPIQVRCKGPNGLGPEWIPLKEDWSNRWCTLPLNYTMDFANRIASFKSRDTDVFLVSSAKTGSTWMLELSWLLLNNLDYQKAQQSYGMVRSPYLEHSGVDSMWKADSIDACEQIQDNPRLIKSHLPAHMLPREIFTHGRKTIYVARNPKDVVVSTYHFFSDIKYWKCSIDEFVDDFVADKTPFSSYWGHLVDFYRLRNEKNIFFVTYEEMKRDLKGVVRRLSRFLNFKDLTDNEMEKLLSHLSFENMKKSQFGNHKHFLKTFHETTDNFEFLRRGIIGSYKDELSADSINKINTKSRLFFDKYGIIESDIFGIV
ncbi:luciferin sulfotransferase-like isoform X2 [Drosophila takahashii]|uniref:luciferin sulfotransferase-like isoform X2 n=1 Tax=Drosophila takahashii TaxID=29030 RepID=UPI003898EE99